MAAFTTIAAGASLAITAGSTTASFIQAGQARNRQERAERAAAKMMKEARSKLDKNVFEDLDINKQVYEIEQERVNQQAQAALQAGQEGDTRGAAATAGRVQMATQAGQANVRAQQEKEVNRIEEMIAKEEGRLRDLNVQLDLAEVQGAQQAAKDAEVARAAYMQQGMAGLQSTVQQGLGMVPLFSAGTAGTQKGVVGGMDLSTAAAADPFNIKTTTGTGANAKTTTTPVTFDVGNQKGVTLDQIKFGDLTNKQFKEFRAGLTGPQSNLIFGSEQYLTGLNQATGANMFGQNFAAGGAAGGTAPPLTLAQIQQLRALGFIN